MHKYLSDLAVREEKVFKKLNSPLKVQNYLAKLPINFELKGDTLYSPRRVLAERKAHCFEGAIFAAAVLWHHGHEPILLDLKTEDYDESHVVALFKHGGKWGAISKTNHASLRYRDPVYASPREIAMSYFHEYFLHDGEKTLRSFAVFNLKKVKKNWITDPEDVWYIDDALDEAMHTQILTSDMVKKLRKADIIERNAGKIVEWKKR